MNSPLQHDIRVSIREHQLDNSDFKKLLKDSKNKNGDNFILSIPIYKVIELLKQVSEIQFKPMKLFLLVLIGWFFERAIDFRPKAQELNLITEYNKYFITNLVSHFGFQLTKVVSMMQNVFLSPNSKDAYKLSYDFLGDLNKNITTLSLVNLDSPKDQFMAKLIRDYRVGFD